MVSNLLFTANSILFNIFELYFNVMYLIVAIVETIAIYEL